MLCRSRRERFVLLSIVAVCLLSAAVTAQTPKLSTDSRIGYLRSLAANAGSTGESPVEGDAVALNNLAVRLANEGEVAKALEASRRSVQLDAAFAPARVNLALIYDWSGDLDSAYREAKAAVEIDGRYVRARSYLCELELVFKRYPEAAKCYRSVLDDFPPHIDVQTRYAIALIEAGQLTEATLLAAKLYAVHPEEIQVMVALANAYFRSREFQKAIDLLKPAVERHPDEPRLRFNLGMAYLGAKNRPAALSQYSLIKESDPELAGSLYRELFRKYIIDVRK